MFPTIIQQTFAWLVPACVGALGVASIRQWWRQASPRSSWLLSAGAFAVAHAVLTIANLQLQGTDHGSVPFSAGETGYGPRYVLVYFLSYSNLVGATVCWALATLRLTRPEP
jgi:hypothetical protein